jgi:hypothetical protein
MQCAVIHGDATTRGDTMNSSTRATTITLSEFDSALATATRIAAVRAAGHQATAHVRSNAVAARTGINLVDAVAARTGLNLVHSVAARTGFSVANAVNTAVAARTGFSTVAAQRAATAEA